MLPGLFWSIELILLVLLSLFGYGAYGFLSALHWSLVTGQGCLHPLRFLLRCCGSVILLVSAGVVTMLMLETLLAELAGSQLPPRVPSEQVIIAGLLVSATLITLGAHRSRVRLQRQQRLFQARNSSSASDRSPHVSSKRRRKQR